MGPLMDDARQLSEEQGWQIGTRGPGRIIGWEEDFCADCKVRHPRTYCDGWRGRCRHRSLYTVTRPKDGKTLHTCGSHVQVLIKELVPGSKLELEETPI